MTNGIPPPTRLDLVGPVGLAAMAGIDRAILDDRRSKGLVPEPDAVVSGTPVWLRSRMARWDPYGPRPAPHVPPPGSLPPLVGTREMAALFGLTKRAPETWRNRRLLPVEDCYVKAAHPNRGTPVWLRDRILAWAAYTRPVLFDRPDAQVRVADLSPELQKAVADRYRGQPAPA